VVRGQVVVTVPSQRHLLNVCGGFVFTAADKAEFTADPTKLAPALTQLFF